MPITIVLADDHPSMRQRIRRLLSLDPELAVVGEAVDGVDAIALVRTIHPQVVVMDVQMPRLDGLTAAATIVQEHPETAVVLLTTVPPREGLAAALRAGVRGYLSKDDPSQLWTAIKAVAAGGVHFSPDAQRLLAD